jgi:predicted nucleotidyltransferase
MSLCAEPGVRRGGERWVLMYHTIFDDTPVVVAWLFGSRAGGSRRVHARSDIDIAVLFALETAPEEREYQRLELIGRLSATYCSDAINPTVLNNALPLLHYKAIQRPRHVLYNRDDKAGWHSRCAPCRTRLGTTLPPNAARPHETVR